jgi:hypothetical protein
MALMRRSQRVRVAKELNAAILESQGQGMETRLGGLVRMMNWGEEVISKAGVTLPGDERESLGLLRHRIQNSCTGKVDYNGIFNNLFNLLLFSLQAEYGAGPSPPFVPLVAGQSDAGLADHLLFPYNYFVCDAAKGLKTDICCIARC